MLFYIGTKAVGMMKLTREQVLSDYQEACDKYQRTLKQLEDEYFEDSEDYQKIKAKATQEYTKARREYFLSRRTFK